MQAKTRDMTVGTPIRLILAFSMPLMLGNILQQVYTITDAAIVGQFVSLDALAALGSADWPHYLVLGFIQGFMHGFSILIAQRFGQKDMPGLRKAIGNSAAMAAAIAVTMTAIATIGCAPMLRAMRVPAEIFDMAHSYLFILFCAIPVVTLYNLLSAILRSLGDSKTPLFAMLAASLVNIALDLLFILAFRWGVAGAAIATVIGQCVSCAYCFIVMVRSRALALRRSDFALDKPLVRDLLRLGGPVAAQNAVIAFGGIVLQRVINAFGVTVIAGFNATNKLYGLIELAAVSFGYAVSTYVGQNRGARLRDRIKRGVRDAAILSLGVSVAIGLAVVVFGRQILGLFIAAGEQNAAEAMAVAYRYLSAMGICLPILYMLHVYRSALQGLGDTFLPMLSGFAELAMRLGAALLLPIWFGLNGLYAAEVLAWFGAMVLLMWGYFFRIRTPSA